MNNNESSLKHDIIGQIKMNAARAVALSQQLQLLHCMRSEQRLAKQIRKRLPYRWFVGLTDDDQM